MLYVNVPPQRLPTLLKKPQTTHTKTGGLSKLELIKLYREASTTVILKDKNTNFFFLYYKSKFKK